MATIRERIKRALQQELLTVEEVALISQYDPNTIYRKVKARKIPGVVRFGRGIRFQRDAILGWSNDAKLNRSSA
jgi:excisionase family DNA binding protein